LGRENDGQVLNLSGLLHGTFHQHLDDRFEVPWLGGHFVPGADGQEFSPYQPSISAREKFIDYGGLREGYVSGEKRQGQHCSGLVVYMEADT